MSKNHAIELIKERFELNAPDKPHLLDEVISIVNQINEVDLGKNLFITNLD